MANRLLSGIQPSGELHVGNYLGAVRNWVSSQDSHDAFFFVADLHAVTQEYDVTAMPGRVRDMVASLLACGIDPERATVFVQSHVPGHADLAWLLGCVAPMGELERMTQFKQKSERHPENINAGLFLYPVLQAADILLYKAGVVPVGEDQVQHLELTREVARRFNGRFGPIFPEPKPLLTRSGRIRGLDGQAKMSKSLNNYIPILADEATIQALLRPAFTDPARLRKTDPGHPEVCNLFSLHQGFSPASDVANIDHDCRVAAIGCVACKKLLATNMAATLAPIRERFTALTEARVREVVADGAARAARVARETMDQVKAAMGL